MSAGLVRKTTFSMRTLVSFVSMLYLNGIGISSVCSFSSRRSWSIQAILIPQYFLNIERNGCAESLVKYKNNLAVYIYFLLSKIECLLFFKMESCVLIPKELSLTGISLPNKKKEFVLTVCATANIKKGTLFCPFQGTIRTDKIENLKRPDENDVSALVPINNNNTF